MKLLPLSIGVLGLALAAVGGLYFGRSQPPPRDPARAEIAELKAEVARLAAAQRRPRSDFQTAWLAANAARPSSAAPVAPKASSGPDFRSAQEFQASVEARHEQEKKLHAERRERIEQELELETRDLGWAPQASDTVQAWLALPALAGYALEGVDCRTTLCRASIQIPNDQRLDQFLSTIQEQMGVFGSSSLNLVTRADGSRTIVGFFGRIDEPLPK